MHLTIFCVYYWFNCVEINCKLQQRDVVLFVNFMYYEGINFQICLYKWKNNRVQFGLFHSGWFLFCFCCFWNKWFPILLIKVSEMAFYASIPVCQSYATLRLKCMPHCDHASLQSSNQLDINQLVLKICQRNDISVGLSERVSCWTLSANDPDAEMRSR